MRTASLFTPVQADIDALISAYPLAQLISLSPVGFLATSLPLLIERNPDGGATLLGHFARANSHIEALEPNADALAIFMGPQGYISSSWFNDRTQAPTRNFATVQMAVRVAFDRAPSAARQAVDRLTEHMERDRPKAWSRRDMGARYDRLIPHVVAFRAHGLDAQVKFKLGQ